ncbi:MAG: hypothetical protein IT427_15300 [Pirellulales bacterium]|nr:hypothetical protein [Pirellulales bacterium]
MMILDQVLAQREAAGRPIRIGLIGAGFMGRGIILQLGTPLVGMRLSAIASRNVDTACRAWSDTGLDPPVVATNQTELDNSVAANRQVVTSDPMLLCRAAGIDVVIEATGQVESGAHTVLEAFAQRKHVVLMNAELDATIGPILKVRADTAGVCISNADGDEPAIAFRLLRHVQSIGYRPVLAGNVKGFLDRYRTAATQQGFAERTKQNPKMVASYADGTKLNLEACLVANATGFRVGQRGMLGPKCLHVKDIVKHFSPAQLLAQPLVDYALGAEPGSGVFVVGYNDQPSKQHYMRYLKMGDGPLYVFYSPHVLPHLEAPLTAAQLALFGGAAITPRGAPVCEVIATAKRDLKAGEILDGLGGFASYGLIENAEVARAEKMLPMGLSVGCRLLRDVRKDMAIVDADVQRPEGRLCDRLWAEQDGHFQPLASSASSGRSIPS